MNVNIYNEAVANFQEKIEQHKNAVTNGVKKPRNLEEFKALTKELADLASEYRNLSNSLNNPKDQEDLDKFLQKELAYLDVYASNMEILKHYYKVSKDINVEKDWESLHTLIYEYSLQEGVKKTEELMKIQPDNSKIIENHKLLSNALSNIKDKSQYAYGEMLKKSENTRKIEANIREIKGLVDSHKEKIINGSLVPRNLNEFSDIYKNVEYMLNSLSLYNEGSFKEEKEYLSSLYNFMSLLKSTQDEKTILNGWSSIQKIFYIKDINKGLKKAQELLKLKPGNEEIENRIMMLKNILLNFTNDHQEEEAVINYFSDEFDNMEQLAIKSTVEDQIVIDEEYLREDDSVIKNINYLNNIISNILKMPGEKTDIIVNGTRVKVPVNFVSLYSKCIALKRELLNKKQDYEQNLYKKYDISSEFWAKYYEVENKYKTIEEKLDSLVFNAKLSNGNKIKVMDFFIEPPKDIEILESDLDTYKKLKQEFDVAELLGDNFATYYHKNVSLETKKQTIIETLGSLRKANLSEEQLEKEVKTLKEELCALDIFMMVKTKANFRRILKKQGYSKEEAEYFADIAYEPDKIARDQSVSNEKRKSVIETILNIMQLDISDEEDQDFVDNYQDIDEENNVDEQKISMKERIANVKEKIANLKFTKKCLEYKDKFVSKIKGLKKAKNPAKIKTEISKKVTIVCETLAFGAVLGTTIYLVNNVNFESSNSLDKSSESNMENTESNSYLDKFLIKIPSDSEIQKNTNTESPINPFLFGNTQSEKQNDHNKIPSLMDNIPSELLENNNVSDLTTGMVDSVNKSLQESNNHKNFVDNNKGNMNSDPKKESNDAVVDNSWNNYYSMGDTFTLDNSARIYENIYDAKDQKNGDSSYFKSDSQREIIGIAYMETNGNVILLRAEDPELKNKMTALENNGAVQVAVKTMNLEVGYGVEGYYNIEDITEGKSR